MTSFQVSLFQLDNYGPWTTTPSPRPEPTLQALQGRLYADLVEMIGTHDGYAFFGRFDNIVAITNGIDTETHQQIQQSIGEHFPVTVSVGIGSGETPVAALTAASRRLQEAGSAQDPDRTEILAGGHSADTGSIQVAHFDIVDVTNQLTDQHDAHGVLLAIQDAVQTLSEYLYSEYHALSYFVGGDNVIAISPELTRADYRHIIDVLRDQHDLQFQVGIGTGTRATEAGMAAKHALETCREQGTAVEGLETPPPRN